MQHLLETIELLLDIEYESLVLGALIAAVSGPIFAITHEATKWIIAKWRSHRLSAQ
jgi:hypothetical protein